MSFMALTIKTSLLQDKRNKLQIFAYLIFYRNEIQ